MKIDSLVRKILFPNMFHSWIHCPTQHSEKEFETAKVVSPWHFLSVDPDSWLLKRISDLSCGTISYQNNLYIGFLSKDTNPTFFDAQLFTTDKPTCVQLYTEETFLVDDGTFVESFTHFGLRSKVAIKFNQAADYRTGYPHVLYVWITSWNLPRWDLNST